MKYSVAFIRENFLFILGGIPVSLEVVAVALLISTPLGFILALLRNKKIPVIDQLLALYVSFMRGTPLIVQIFIMYSGGPRFLNALVKQMGLEIDVFGVNPIHYAFAVFSINSTAFMCEVFRSALASVGKEQMEVAVSVGLTKAQAYRRIILPQAMVSAIPNICNNTLKLFKNTSLVYVMSIMDITGRAKYAAGEGYNYIEAYTMIFIVYIVICLLMERGFAMLEDRLKVFRKPLAA